MEMLVDVANEICIHIPVHAGIQKSVYVCVCVIAHLCMRACDGLWAGEQMEGTYTCICSD